MSSFLNNLFAGGGSGQTLGGSVLIIILIIWSFIWKGLALWHASKNEEKYWFVAVLVLNTVGILEIAYLFVFSKKKWDINKVKKFIASYI